MNFLDDIVRTFQELVGQVPELVQPFVVMLAGAIPFVEGEGAGLIGVIGGVNPVVAGIAAAAGNFLAVLLIVLLTSRARTAAVDRRVERAPAAAAETAAPKPPSKGRQRFSRWLVRYGVPGASLLGPLAIPSHFIAGILVAGGTSRSWVLLWQTVSIVVWTTLATVSAWAALTFVVGV